MPTPQLPLCPDTRDTAWRAIVDEIQVDDTVRGLGILWRLPDDHDHDDDAPNERITVVVTPTFGTMEPFAAVGNLQVVYVAPVVLGLDITVAGYSASNAAAVWSAIQHAAMGANLSHSDRYNFRKRLRAAGVHEPNDLVPAMSPMDTTTASGSLTFNTMIRL